MLWIIVILLAALSLGATRNVPADHGTIQGAVNASVAGDIIRVANGTYNETVTLSKSGITIRANNRHGAIIDCQGSRNLGVVSNGNYDNNTIDGFEIKNCNTMGIQVESNLSGNWTITNNYIHHIRQRGIHIRGNNHKITENRINNIGNREESYCMYVFNANNLVKNNVAYLCGKNAFRSRSFNNRIESNIFYAGGTCYSSNSGDGGDEVYNNLIYDCMTGANIKHADCVSGQNNARTRFWHNTLLWFADDAIASGMNCPETRCNDFRNNVIIEDNSALWGLNGSNAITHQERRSAQTVINGNFYELNGINIYRNPGAGDPCAISAGGAATYSTIAQLRNSTPHEDNGQVGNAGIVNFRGGGVIGYGATVNAGGVNWGSPYGDQLGAHGLRQVTPKIDYIWTLDPVSASAGQGTMGRLVDGGLNPLWEPGTTNGNVVIELNNGNNVTFELFMFHGDGAPDDGTNEINAFALDVGPTAGGGWTEVLTDGGNTYDRSASWMLFGLSSPQTNKYIRWRYQSTHGGDPQVAEIRVANIVDQDEVIGTDTDTGTDTGTDTDTGTGTDTGTDTDTDTGTEFPSTPILDNFNRADEVPIAGPNWANGVSSTGSCEIVGSSIQSGTGSEDCYWTATFGEEQEAYITLLDGSTHNDLSFIDIYVCLQEPGSAAFDGYAARHTKQTTADTFQIFRIDNGAHTAVASGTFEMSNGSKMGIRRISTGVVSAYANSGAGWAKVLEWDDPTPLSCNNTRIGLGPTQPSQDMDDFGGGNAVIEEPPSEFVPAIRFMD